jgi:hypothetical protein
MKIYTSYYSKTKYFPDKSKLVSISLDCGRLAKFEGRVYKKLTPPYDLLQHWHKHKDVDYYTINYHERVLNKLNPHEVAKELGDGAVLICYEKNGDFCHRHLVAEWFRNAGIDCEEFKF